MVLSDLERTRIEDASDAQLLLTLILRNGFRAGPAVTRYIADVQESLVTVGPDHTISVRFYSDDLGALYREAGVTS